MNAAMSLETVDQRLAEAAVVLVVVVVVWCSLGSGVVLCGIVVVVVMEL